MKVSDGSSRSTTATITEPALVQQALGNLLVFRPVPPGDAQGGGGAGLSLPQLTIEVDAEDQEWAAVQEGVQAGVLPTEDVLRLVRMAALPEAIGKALLGTAGGVERAGWDGQVDKIHEQDRLAVLALKIVRRAHELLLAVEPLTEVHLKFSDRARAVLAVGWEAMAGRGIFPLPPLGSRRIDELRKRPCGAMHFVSASDLDAGYYYTMGIAMSPEAQALGTIDASYGLDGELIVPGQAVSPIPPFLAMATRLFAASIPTSSNISEEVQSIPMRNYPHPTSQLDLEPRRGGLYRPPKPFDTVEEAIDDLRRQLWKNRAPVQLTSHGNERFLNPSAADPNLPPVKAVFEVSGMVPGAIRHWLSAAFEDEELADKKPWIALYLNIEATGHDRVTRINEVVDVAKDLGLKYVAVADDVKDEWLPNLLEYLEPWELNAVADYSDEKGVIVTDGRPVDPIYTAATSAQRIQSVYSTLAVDILKMGMWLCLDALAARTVYRELLKNPHIPRRMLLMPIGIVEPWNAFVDNRDPDRTARAILDPFEKIKFMIEEAKELGMPSLLTDTRHKETWVLLGRKTDADEPHPREDFVVDPATKALVCRKPGSAVPLLSWEEFMQCERLARQAGILLGQAGSIETPQVFHILSETTYDAAKEGKNPATAIWTAETERVLSTKPGSPGADLQTERSAPVLPFLAIVNRGFESHAKLDGWLRYLEGLAQGDPALRQDLGKRREESLRLLQDVLDAQGKLRSNSDPRSQSSYRSAWDRFRTAYLEYHRLVKNNFVRIRDLVENAWSAGPKN